MKEPRLSCSELLAKNLFEVETLMTGSSSSKLVVASRGRLVPAMVLRSPSYRKSYRIRLY